MTIFMGIVLCLEVGGFVLIAAALLRTTGYTVAESGAVAIMAVLAMLGLVHQIDFFTGSPWPGIVFETTVTIVCLRFAVRRIGMVGPLLAAARQCFRVAPLPASILAVAWTAMAGIIVSGWFAADLTVALVGPALTPPAAPLGGTALFYHAARFGLSPDAFGMGLLSHMAIGLATYALARRHAWPPMALTVCLIVLSMPRLTLVGLHPSTETTTTVSAVVAIVLLFRLLEQHRSVDLWLFMTAALSTIGGEPMSLALALVLMLLAAVTMIRRHGWPLCRQMVTSRPWLAVLMLVPAAALAQLPVFLLNLSSGDPLFGTVVAFDTDGIFGATANLLRFMLVSVDPTGSVARLLDWLVGLDLYHLMMAIDRLVIDRLFGQAGASVPFEAVFSGGGQMGFGPIAPLLILPSLGYALIRGTRRLKAMAVAWGGYLYLAALIVAWQPACLALLTPLFAANGVMLAFAIPPWRLRHRGRRLLQILCALLLAGSLVWGMGQSIPSQF